MSAGFSWQDRMRIMISVTCTIESKTPEIHDFVAQHTCLAGYVESCEWESKIAPPVRDRHIIVLDVWGYGDEEDWQTATEAFLVATRHALSEARARGCEVDLSLLFGLDPSKYALVSIDVLVLILVALGQVGVSLDVNCCLCAEDDEKS